MGWPLIEQQVALIELRAVIGLILVGAFVSCAESPATNSRMRTTRIARGSRTNSESKLTMTIRQIAQARPTKEAIQSSFASICSLPAPPINPSRPQTAGDAFGPSPFEILKPNRSSTSGSVGDENRTPREPALPLMGPSKCTPHRSGSIAPCGKLSSTDSYNF